MIECGVFGRTQQATELPTVDARHVEIGNDQGGWASAPEDMAVSAASALVKARGASPALRSNPDNSLS